tara:strand:- start:19 stop:672 length:654 start_codon:yes stop_codon:yes gene_type:complete
MELDNQHLAYEPIVENYANNDEPDPELRTRFHELFMQSLSGKNVLEVGCGPGHDAARLRDAGCTVTATDLCEGFIKYASDKYTDIDFQCMDLQEPTFPSDTFDGVFGSSCFCHIRQTNIGNILGKYYEILKPGGLILMMLSDSEQADGYVVEDWGDVEGNTVEMFFHNRNTLKNYLEDAGFEDVCITPLRSPFYEELPRLKKLAIRLYAISARKAGA